MLSPDELFEMQQKIYRTAEVEQMCSCSGSYTYCCCTPQGVVYLSHEPHGRVLRHMTKSLHE